MRGGKKIRSRNRGQRFGPRRVRLAWTDPAGGQSEYKANFKDLFMYKTIKCQNVAQLH